MTKLNLEIEETLTTKVNTYTKLEKYSFIFENDSAAMLAAAGFAVEDKVKVCTTERIKEENYGIQK